MKKKDEALASLQCVSAGFEESMAPQALRGCLYITTSNHSKTIASHCADSFALMLSGKIQLKIKISSDGSFLPSVHSRKQEV